MSSNTIFLVLTFILAIAVAVYLFGVSKGKSANKVMPGSAPTPPGEDEEESNEL